MRESVELVEEHGHQCEASECLVFEKHSLDPQWVWYLYEVVSTMDQGQDADDVLTDEDKQVHELGAECLLDFLLVLTGDEEDNGQGVVLDDENDGPHDDFLAEASFHVFLASIDLLCIRFRILGRFYQAYVSY